MEAPGIAEIEGKYTRIIYWVNNLGLNKYL
jgi:hypothetical protein